jgi:hypothetical protein
MKARAGRDRALATIMTKMKAPRPETVWVSDHEADDTVS